MSRRNRILWIPLLWYGLAVVAGITVLENVPYETPFSKAFTTPFECLAVWRPAISLIDYDLIQFLGLTEYVWTCLFIGLSGWAVIAYILRLAYLAQKTDF